MLMQRTLKASQPVHHTCCLIQEEEVALHRIADLIKAGKAKKIICMCGAGISVAAGIPDFRSPGE